MNLWSSLMLSSYKSTKTHQTKLHWQPVSPHAEQEHNPTQTPTVLIAALVNGDLGDGFRMMKDDMSAASWAYIA
jgi:hypothetical protein